MNVIIAGAGEVGEQTALVLTQEGHNTTLIDLDDEVLQGIQDGIDVRTLVGNAASAEVLISAGARQADLFVAATDLDEINLFSASIAKGLGTNQVIARVHHSAYFTGQGLDYADHLHIDHLVCPEYLASLEIPAQIRDPGVHAIEHFARGEIEMEHLVVTASAAAAGHALNELQLPSPARVGTVQRNGVAIVPQADTKILAGDRITLIAPTAQFDAVRQVFHPIARTRRKVVISGGSATSVWLGRALRSRRFSVRLFEPDRARAEEISEKLPHVTVLNADASEPTVFEEEEVATADALVAASPDDEHNILTAVYAHTRQIPQTFAVLHHPTYADMVLEMGVTAVISPRQLASREIHRLAATQPFHTLATLAGGEAHIYQTRVGPNCPKVYVPLAQLKLPDRCILVALQRGEEIHFPTPEDRLQPNDTVVAIVGKGQEHALRDLVA